MTTIEETSEQYHDDTRRNEKHVRRPTTDGHYELSEGTSITQRKGWVTKGTSDSVKERVHVNLKDTQTTTISSKYHGSVTSTMVIPWPVILHIIRRRFLSFKNIIIIKMSPPEYIMLVSLDRHWKYVVKSCFF